MHGNLIKTLKLYIKNQSTYLGNFIKKLIIKIKINNLKGLTFYVFYAFSINPFLRKHQVYQYHNSKILQNYYIVLI